MSEMRTTQILEKVCACTNGNAVLTTEDGYYNISTPKTIVGNGTETLIEGVAGKKIIIKGITILGDGNAGSVKIVADGVTYLPCYFSAQNKAGVSAQARIQIPENTDVEAVLVGRGTSETFIGITYYRLEV
jgi:hypothetical protein